MHILGTERTRKRTLRIIAARGAGPRASPRSGLPKHTSAPSPRSEALSCPSPLSIPIGRQPSNGNGAPFARIMSSRARGGGGARPDGSPCSYVTSMSKAHVARVDLWPRIKWYGRPWPSILALAFKLVPSVGHPAEGVAGAAVPAHKSSTRLGSFPPIRLSSPPYHT